MNCEYCTSSVESKRSLQCFFVFCFLFLFLFCFVFVLLFFFVLQRVLFVLRFILFLFISYFGLKAKMLYCNVFSQSTWSIEKKNNFAMLPLTTFNYDVALTAGMAKTRGDQFSYIRGVWRSMIHNKQFKALDGKENALAS